MTDSDDDRERPSEDQPGDEPVEADDSGEPEDSAAEEAGASKQSTDPPVDGGGDASEDDPAESDASDEPEDADDDSELDEESPSETQGVDSASEEESGARRDGPGAQSDEPENAGGESEVQRDESEEADGESATTGEDEWRPDSDESDGAAAGEEDRTERLRETLRERRPDAPDQRLDPVLAALDDVDADRSVEDVLSAAVLAVDAGVDLDEILEADGEYVRSEAGVAAFFDHPDELLRAARVTRESPYERFDAYSPFPIHGMDEAMGLGRSWIPWVTFGAGLFGFLCAIAMQFGMMTFDWPMIIGGKPFAPWPAFVPIMFELTVLIGGVTTGLVMLRAAGCFEPADVIDPGITDDRFALWISGDDPDYDQREVVEFVQRMDPVEVRTFSEPN